MFGNLEKMELSLFDLEELAKPENRVKMCYAFMRSENLFHQELSIYNPKPTQFLPDYVFPKDLFIYTHYNESKKALLPLEELRMIAANAATPIMCIGSHIEGVDRTMQLIALPQSMTTDKLAPEDLIFIRFLAPVSDIEKSLIMEALKNKYYSL